MFSSVVSFKGKKKFSLIVNWMKWFRSVFSFWGIQSTSHSFFNNYVEGVYSMLVSPKLLAMLSKSDKKELAYCREFQIYVIKHETFSCLDLKPTLCDDDLGNILCTL